MSSTSPIPATGHNDPSSARTGHRVVLLTTAACHLCEDAHEELARREALGQLTREVVTADSEQGRALIAAHRPGLFPLVLLDGRVLGHGRLSRRKLDRTLRTVKAG